MEDNKEYVLPSTDIIENKDIINAIKNNKEDNFIPFLDNGKIFKYSLKSNPNTLLYGIQEIGKSSFVKTAINTILLTKKPDEAKMMIIDTRMLEHVCYNGIPHLLRPVVTDPRKASVALQLIVQEIEHRYDIFEQTQVRNIYDYNQKVDRENENREANDKWKKLPPIYVFIDELNDLLIYSKKEIREIMLRMLQLSRQAGIIVIAVTKNLEPAIMDNELISMFPARVCFRANSSKESITMINKKNACDLEVGEFYLNTPENRYDGDYKTIKMSDEETRSLIDYVRSQAKAIYDARFENLDNEKPVNSFENKNEINAFHIIEDENDPLYKEIVAFVIEQGKASASLLQRRFKLGYNQAARVIDMLEESGIIGPATGNSKPREILVKFDNDSNDETPLLDETVEIPTPTPPVRQKTHRTSYTPTTKEKKEAIWAIIFFVTFIIALIISAIIKK